MIHIGSAGHQTVQRSIMALGSSVVERQAPQTVHCTAGCPTGDQKVQTLDTAIEGAHVKAGPAIHVSGVQLCS